MLQHDLDMYAAISGRRPALLPEPPPAKSTALASLNGSWSPLVLCADLHRCTSGELPCTSTGPICRNSFASFPARRATDSAKPSPASPPPVSEGRGTRSGWIAIR